MCNICDGDYNDETTKLNISYCKNVSRIPFLQELSCDNCENITDMVMSYL